ncbi:ribonuclease E/G [Parvularcula maris]|uniref:Ribonuclease E n=1 Tax=Parvularcula maris TaxID=2965077 RepID=A0A9X2RIL3_9PROT|nr:Rne/Rng family ribonuclease [Parvularcula maris]MCQ8185101.1 Rne/Rng family ribonuclease [Parvularcula maris]
MPKTMLIDAYHQEETRVAVLQGGKVEDFDFEFASRKPLRGNIYLARVTRVEPSLQAAFIEYGGNRHGFLAFGEIHPDYYQIPVADREVLRKAEALEVELAQKLAELNQHDDDDEALDPDEDELRASAEDGVTPEAGEDDEEEAEASADAGTDETEEADAEDLPADYTPDSADDAGDWHAADETLIEAVGEEAKKVPVAGDDDAPAREEEEEEEEERPAEASAALEAEDSPALRSEEQDDENEAANDDDADRGAADDAEPSSSEETSEAASSEDETGDAEARADDKPAKEEPSEEELAARERQREIDRLRSRYEEAKRDRNRLLRNYKIQEVIKRRQIMLVQVVKEERGNKGAALTTYLSLAGRYGVLMPNTARGGGISRKITSQGDRKRLKKAMSELDIAPNMGLIIRTAGAKRSKTEIKRDYDYLSRLWGTIREKTLESVAPALIYEEASLIKRAIRDLYDKDTEQIVVQGERGYREAKDFMKMLMPSHAKFVQQHKSAVPIFQKFKVEDQLDGMYQPVVQLKSGGYLVIQQTEAMVSIDVNSGRSTKERNVEQTALKTNLEAAAEVCRQCRLRDLAGLIVIDFIDMEENRNNRAVEKKLKETIKNDRARTQIGSISSFGLLEMSRQRRRSGIVDGTTQACPVCDGAGHVRSHEMAALRILRAAESEAGRGKHGLVTVKASTEMALYILNTKRSWLERLEKTYGVKMNVLADSSRYGDQYEVTGSGSPSEAISLKETIGEEGPLSDFDAPELPSGEDDRDESGEKETKADSEDGEGRSKRRRRRRRRGKGSGGDGEENSSNEGAEAKSDDKPEQTEEKAAEQGEAESTDDSSAASDDENGDKEDGPKRRRRRGRRGGRRNRRGPGEDQASGEENGDEEAAASADAETPDEGAEAAGDAVTPVEAAEPATRQQPDEQPGDAAAAVSDEAEKTEEADEGETSVSEPAAPEETEPVLEEVRRTDAEPAAEPVAAAAPSEPEADKPRRGGWWQRAFQKD